MYSPQLHTLGFALLALAGPLLASVSLDSARISPDITVSLAGQLVSDENVGDDGLGGTVSLVSIGSIPPNASLSAYHLLESGDQLFALDTAAKLGGSFDAGPQDVVRYDGADYSLEFAGAGFGIPAGARIDALSVNGNGDLLLSFDISLSLDGHLIVDEDLVAFDGANFSLFFDGSIAGINPALDLDAAHFLATNNVLILSFDGSGVASATPFSDEDLLQYDLTTPAWAMAYEGSVQHPGWVAADLDAAYVTLVGELLFMDGFETP